MAQIYETENFIVEAFETPHITKTDGGHIRIYPKRRIVDRSEMTHKEAIEFIRLTMIVGKALEIAMTNRGIEIMRVNYHDMGNWAYKKGENPTFHLHIYGRAKNAKFQPYQEAVYLPDRSSRFYDNFEPLDNEDILEIQKQIKIIEEQDKYQPKSWET